MSQEYYTPEVGLISFAQQGMWCHVLFVVGEGTWLAHCHQWGFQPKLGGGPASDGRLVAEAATSPPAAASSSAATPTSRRVSLGPRGQGLWGGLNSCIYMFRWFVLLHRNVYIVTNSHAPKSSRCPLQSIGETEEEEGWSSGTARLCLRLLALLIELAALRRWLTPGPNTT